MTSILVSNDDGIGGPGLLPLKQALEGIGEVTVIAPDRQWTASGHAKTMHKPLRIQQVNLPDGSLAYSSSGAPSDCVALAVLGFLPQPPDMVVSGINLGANVGHDITYSGTLAAAFEGTVSGIPSIAASLDTYDDGDFRWAAEFVASLAKEVLARGLPQSVLLNVNVPNVPREQIAGVKITRLGRRLYRDQLVKRKDPRGRDYYWIGGERPTGDADEEGTDIWALASSFLSVTPIHLDMTDYSFLEELESWRLAF
ncbi:MAG TPA: 5'/3'-nucleotidase SurE [Chloroflexi bacterium]|nr:5'/3'-nucleotidase SurE [Chloroflexota bacterium]